MYAYRARDPMGKIIDGVLEAASAEEVSQHLRRDGLVVLEVNEGGEPLLGGRISNREIVLVTTQLAVMVDTGITLSSALEGLMAQEQNQKLRSLLNDLKRDVEGGSDFSSALEKHPKHFDQTYVALVRASEASGKLGEMLERISEYLRRRLENRAKVRSAMTYPAVICGLAIGVTIFLLTFVMPKFTPIFGRKGMSLPSMTVVMMKLSEALTTYWYAWIAGAVVFTISAVIWLRTPQGRRAWDSAILRLPILGPLFRKVILSRSISTLGTMIAAGVNTLEALRLCGESAGNAQFQEVWNQVRERVSGGEQICEALTGNPLVPGTLVQMISSGEQSGRLDEVLAKVSSFYDREVEIQLKTATSLIEPIMIGIMGVIVGTIGLSLLLPIFSLSKRPG